MERLNQPLKLWHGLIVIALALVLGGGAGALATNINRDRGKAVLGTSHGYVYVQHHFRSSANGVTQGVVDCGRHEVVVAGGGLNEAQAGQFLTSSYPHNSRNHGRIPNGWAIFAANTTGTDQGADVYAICQKVG
jgi:hypothetical protein